VPGDIAITDRKDDSSSRICSNLHFLSPFRHRSAHSTIAVSPSGQRDGSTFSPRVPHKSPLQCCRSAKLLIVLFALRNTVKAADAEHFVYTAAPSCSCSQVSTFTPLNPNWYYVHVHRPAEPDQSWSVCLDRRGQTTTPITLWGPLIIVTRRTPGKYVIQDATVLRDLSITACISIDRLRPASYSSHGKIHLPTIKRIRAVQSVDVQPNFAPSFLLLLPVDDVLVRAENSRARLFLFRLRLRTSTSFSLGSTYPFRSSILYFCQLTHLSFYSRPIVCVPFSFTVHAHLTTFSICLEICCFYNKNCFCRHTRRVWHPYISVALIYLFFCSLPACCSPSVRSQTISSPSVAW